MLCLLQGIHFDRRALLVSLQYFDILVLKIDYLYYLPRINNGTLMSTERLFVYVGHTDLAHTDANDIFPVAKIIPHPDYVSPKHGNDIGLLRLARPINFADDHHYVRCLCQPLVPPDKVIGDLCYVVGWGTVDRFKPNRPSRRLMDAQVPLMSESDCELKVSPGYTVTMDKVMVSWRRFIQDSLIDNC